MWRALSRRTPRGKEKSHFLPLPPPQKVKAFWPVGGCCEASRCDCPPGAGRGFCAALRACGQRKWPRLLWNLQSEICHPRRQPGWVWVSFPPHRTAPSPRGFVVHFGPIHQHFFLRRLVIGDGFERDVRYNPTDFFTLFVLLADIDKPARWAARFVLQLVPRERRGQKALPSQRQRHAAAINRDPAAAPLLGDV